VVYLEFVQSRIFIVMKIYRHVTAAVVIKVQPLNWWQFVFIMPRRPVQQCKTCPMLWGCAHTTCWHLWTSASNKCHPF